MANSGEGSALTPPLEHGHLSDADVSFGAASAHDVGAASPAAGACPPRPVESRGAGVFPASQLGLCYWLGGDNLSKLSANHQPPADNPVLITPFKGALECTLGPYCSPMPRALWLSIGP